jgi:hypothetical protein
MVEPNRDNRVTFEPDINDQFGMPQSTFEFALGEGDRERCHAMMADMCESAMVLGGILPGSEPQLCSPGWPFTLWAHTGWARLTTARA